MFVYLIFVYSFVVFECGYPLLITIFQKLTMASPPVIPHYGIVDFDAEKEYDYNGMALPEE